ncbi:RNA polymerase sigma factor [Singulisphaera sp. PoT]|uniref:RNA polymerase sigma factor n=1 Tax=Singulisphaera sp. PoT TaxID=3411797 RepID=UPI003BF51387
MNPGAASGDESWRSVEDRASREAFVRSSYAELYRWFLRLSGTPDRAADLTQETFAAFWRSSGPGQANVSSRTWLFAVGRNLWRKQIRDRKVAEVLPEELPEPRECSPERLAQDREFVEAVERAVGGLSADLREAFSLRFWNEFSYEEIGTIQGISEGAARWRYFAARRRLHQALADWDPGRSQPEEGRHARH